MNLRAEKIKIQRKRKGMTIKELARKIGYSDAYVSQIEIVKIVSSIGNAIVVLKEQVSFYIACLDEFTVKNIGNKNAEIICIDAPYNI